MSHLRAPVPFALGGAGAARRAGARMSERLAGAAVTLAHLFLIVQMRQTVLDSAAVEPQSELVTYLDVPPPPPASARAAAVKARPLVVSEEVRVPAVQGDVTQPDRMAGFQVLLAPQEARGVPAEAPAAAAAVKAEDFTGRGVVGGVAGGIPPRTVSAATAESLANVGAAADVHLRERPPERALADADRIIEPRLLNREDVADEVLARYPAVLRQAGIEGRAIVQFWVDTTGHAVPGSARVLSSTHELFAQAALAVVPHARFTSGEAIFDGVRVRARILVRLPLTWTMF